MKKFGDLELPVVMDKTTQRKELETVQLPGDETEYYKAYDGEKMVLVPKENLEAMKGLVNYTMRRRADSTVARVPDRAQEEKEMKRFETKMERLKGNITKYEKTQLEPLKAMMEEKKHSIKVKETEHPFKKSEIAISLRRTEPPIKSLETLEGKGEYDKTPLGLKSLSEEISLPSGDYVKDTKSVKFLISGHFINNKKPIFIIRQYMGSSVIGKNFSDFNSVKNGKSVDIFIRGKFYKDSILDEENSKPKNIKFKSRKKIVVDSQSNISEDGFIKLYTISEFDVVVGGMFVKNRKPSLPHYTPLVSIAIKRLKHANSYLIGSFPFETVLSASTPDVQTPFVQEFRKTHSDSKIRSRGKLTIPSSTKQTHGFQSLLTRIDKEEEAFECPPRPRPRMRSLSRSLASTTSSIIHKVKKARINLTLSKISSMDVFSIFKKRKESTDEDKCVKSLGTKSSDEAPLHQTSPPSSVKAEDISLPSISNGNTIKCVRHSRRSNWSSGSAIRNRYWNSEYIKTTRADIC